MPRARTAAVLLLALAALLPWRGIAADEGGTPEITSKELKRWVKELADDDYEGREAGTEACDRAAERLAGEFGRIGLTPLGDDGTWFQAFTSPKGTKVLPTSQLVATDAKGRTTEFDLGEDFAPIDISGAGDVTAGVVFAGYGICDPEGGYDDYAGLDVKGQVVVVLRHAPRWEDKRKSPYATQAAMMKHGTFSAKADVAAAKGAAALIVVNDPLTTSRSDDDLRQPGGSSTGKLPVIHMTWRAGKKLGSRIGVKFVNAQRGIDARLAPRSEVAEGATLRVFADLQADVRRMKNVVGLLEPGAAAVTTGEGTPTGSRETLLIGAHYDHVGRGRFGSLANADGEIHNGADDNASGTTALLEIAGWLASRREQLKRRVLFVLFSGEELGLLGSKHYVREPCLPLADCVAMLNLDMVGRLEKNRLFVGGTGTSPVWPPLLERLNKESGRFELTSWPGGKAPSDHASFYDAGLPVLFFFTGLHGDYHRPSDDPRTLEYRGLERVASFAASVAEAVVNADERPQFVRCDAGGFAVGPYTGLAVESRDDGVYVTHVDRRSPAEKARFREGDKLVEWNGRKVTGTDVYNDLVSKAKPSDKVEVVVERAGRTLRLRLTMGKT